MKASYDITGMNCAACSASVERAVRKLGIEDVSVSLITGVMKIEYNEELVSDESIRSAVNSAGFGIETAKSAAEKRKLLQEEAKRNERNLLTRLISSVIIMLILMYFTMGHMMGLPLPDFLEKPTILAVIQLVFTIPILIINRVYFTNGFKHLLARTPNMDSLIAVGSFAAVIYGIFAIIQIMLGNTHYIHDLYFETAAMIPTLVTVGKFLEGKSRTGTGKALDMLIDLTPKKASVIVDGIEKEVDIEFLKVGDTVIVKPGQSVPCDGRIISGESYIDESSLTGESIPVYKTSGDSVSAGTINSNGTLIVCAEKVGDDTIISGIVRLVEQASGSKAPISRLADKISGIFVPIVIIISIITFIVWILCGSQFEFAFSRAICVLVISCPCALGLATPVAVTVGTGVAASNGILIKNAATL
ncbi:MAG: heavy metal translocating P-type ATPase, partial [Clostridia bacterium]|nr:heavy metal translocating P-type ATPase [Clostridia bacterium]